MKLRIYDKEQFGCDLIEEIFVENNFRKQDLKKLQRYANKCFSYNELIEFIKSRFKVIENSKGCNSYYNIMF